MRLKAMAVERAPTIATVIQTSCHAVGTPPAANTAPRKANGNAKSVCSILIISSVVRMFLVNAAISYGLRLKLETQNSKLETFNRLSIASSSNAESQTDRECESINDRRALQLFAVDDKSRDWPAEFACRLSTTSACFQDE